MLVTLDEVRAVVETDLTDAELLDIIEREEAEMVRLFGPHAAEAPITETVLSGGRAIFLKRPVASLTSITEYGSLYGSAAGVALTTDGYSLDAAAGSLVRLGSRWGPRVVVVYTPVDDTALRRSVLLDLVRLALRDTTRKSENVRVGDVSYSYTAGGDSPTADRAHILRRLAGIRV